MEVLYFMKCIDTVRKLYNKIVNTTFFNNEEDHACPMIRRFGDVGPLFFFERFVIV